MKTLSKYLTRVALLLTIAAFFFGCSFIGDMFKAGSWTGFFILFGAVATVVVIFSSAFKH